MTAKEMRRDAVARLVEICEPNNYDVDLIIARPRFIGVLWRKAFVAAGDNELLRGEVRELASLLDSNVALIDAVFAHGMPVRTPEPMSFDDFQTIVTEALA